MSRFWGWVERRDDGNIDIACFTDLAANTLPDNVLEVMAVLDMMPEGSKLQGGSVRDKWNTKAFSATYYINEEDLKPQDESDI